MHGFMHSKKFIYAYYVEIREQAMIVFIRLVLNLVWSSIGKKMFWRSTHCIYICFLLSLHLQTNFSLTLLTWILGLRPLSRFARWETLDISKTKIRSAAARETVRNESKLILFNFVFAYNKTPFNWLKCRCVVNHCNEN